jgi:hypothetical protein
LIFPFPSWIAYIMSSYFFFRHKVVGSSCRSTKPVTFGVFRPVTCIVVHGHITIIYPGTRFLVIFYVALTLSMMTSEGTIISRTALHLGGRDRIFGEGLFHLMLRILNSMYHVHCSLWSYVIIHAISPAPACEDYVHYSRIAAEFTVVLRTT